MKYRLSSDWHIDNWNTRTLAETIHFIEAMVLPVLHDDKTTTLLLAGDMVTHSKGWTLARKGGLRSHSTGRQLVRYLCERFANVIYVPGNHDYYGSDITSVGDRDSRWGGLPDNFKVLDVLDGGGVLAPGVEGTSRYGHEHGGVVGATLWTDCEGWSHGGGFTDFKLIRHDGNKFMPDIMERCHNKDKLEIARNGSVGGIIMTHHSPSYRQLHSKYEEPGVCEFNPMFHCSDMDTVIDLLKPKWWFHGHIHDAMVSVMPNGCTLISNPFGYPGEYEPTTLTSKNGYDNVLCIVV